VRDEPVFLHPVALAAVDVVIAHDEVQPILLVKSMQQVEYTPVGAPDGTEPPVLPQFVPVSDLDVREPRAVIVVQGVQEQRFIPGKAIRPAVVPPVTVAEENNPGIIVKRDAPGRLKDLGQPPVCQRASTMLEGFPILLRVRSCGDPLNCRDQ
jgi:hypothetical protein